MNIRVGILDSGIGAPDLTRAVADRRDFSGADGVPWLPHGDAVARIVLEHAPDAVLLDARIFGARLATGAGAAAAGLEWLVAAGARVVNLSLGLREDRAALGSACHAALDSGILLIAAAPARGEPVFPAGYPGVIAVCADARCGPGQVSALGGVPAEFGACPRPGAAKGGPAGGSSFATAHVTGILAGFLSRHPEAGADEARAYLQRIAAFHGRERRLA